MVASSHRRIFLPLTFMPVNLDFTGMKVPLYWHENPCAKTVIHLNK